MRRRTRPPIIVVGMHRSGTSVLARLLDAADVLMGADRTMNDESRTFQQVNIQILDSLGAGWRSLESLPPAHDLWRAHDVLVGIAERAVSSRLRHVRYGGVGGMACMGGRGRPWGWKDPRSSLTLPVWLRVYPQASIVHVVRDGRDVARSLGVRSQADYGTVANAEGYKRMFERDLVLWSGYVDRVNAAIQLSGAASHVVRYEHLLDDPEREIQLLLEAVSVSGNAAALARMVRRQSAQSGSTAGQSVEALRPELRLMLERHGY